MIFYDFIKGAASTSAWYWIKFNSTTPSANTNCAPTLLAKSANSTTDQLNAGQFLLAGTSNHKFTQETHNNYIFNGTFEFNNDFVHTYHTNGSNTIKLMPLNFGSGSSATYGIGFVNSNGQSEETRVAIYENMVRLSAPALWLAFDGNSNGIELKTTTNDKEIHFHNKTFFDDTSAGTTSTACANYFAGSIYGNSSATFTQFVSAVYFNSTSDERAKKDIHNADFNALNVVKSLDVKSFKYKDTDKSSVGLIAQELKDINIDDFSFVDNLAATGENGDYMLVKESKLVFVLWKAIQEQQAQIEELKRQLNSK